LTPCRGFVDATAGNHRLIDPSTSSHLTASSSRSPTSSSTPQAHSHPQQQADHAAPHPRPKQQHDEHPHRRSPADQERRHHSHHARPGHTRRLPELNAEVTNFSPTTGSPIKTQRQIPAEAPSPPTATPVRSTETPQPRLTSMHPHHMISLPAESSPDAASAVSPTSTSKHLRRPEPQRQCHRHVEASASRRTEPSPKPVDLDLALSQNMQALTGQIQHPPPSPVPINISGTYRPAAPPPLNLKVGSQGASIDELQDFLPPSASTSHRLPPQGGTLTTSLNVTGSSASPIIQRPHPPRQHQPRGSTSAPNLRVTASPEPNRSVTAIRSLSTDVRVARRIRTNSP